MNRLLALAAAAILGIAAPALSGCGHSHSEDPTRETVGGAYTCPRHGGSYASAEDHCKVCGEHVERK